MIKKFDQFINEEAESALASAPLSYSSPVQSTIKKDTTGGKHNVMEITTNGVARKYRIVGSTGFTNYDLNFKYIQKKPNGDMIFARSVEGGVDPETIPFDKVKDIISKAASGAKDINPVMGLHFYKI